MATTTTSKAPSPPAKWGTGTGARACVRQPKGWRPIWGGTRAACRIPRPSPQCAASPSSPLRTPQLHLSDPTPASRLAFHPSATPPPPPCRDKRDWTDKYIPRDFPMPPEGCNNEAVKELIRWVGGWGWGGKACIPCCGAPAAAPRDAQQAMRCHGLMRSRAWAHLRCPNHVAACRPPPTHPTPPHTHTTQARERGGGEPAPVGGV